MRGLYVTPRMFRFQMWYLRAAGFNVVSLHGILDFIRGEAMPGGPPGPPSGRASSSRLIALTFDDGYMDFYENAWPVLRSYGYPSTVFLVPGLAGEANLWDAEQLGTRKKILDWPKTRELAAGGVSLGAHTNTHPFLTRIPPERLKEEITGSRKTIEDRIGRTVEFFCYPYGDYNAEVVRQVREAGFLGATSVKRGFTCRGDDPFELKRVPVRLNTWPLSFIYKLHSDYEIRKARNRF
ncbi:MAG: polysaccharide deacetylase family protein [Nitrospiraceae bacterium]|nr:polysaccharide deacetylase family protein [Nitrospiraceae bacterium]